MSSSPSSSALQTFQDARLYGIVDLGYIAPTQVEEMTTALCEGGVDVLQLRAKKLTPAEVAKLGRLMLPITRNCGVPLVINDHVEIAAELGTEGVHVGQDDEAVAKARSVVAPGTVVGKSTHSLAQAIAAQAEGADYIGFGPLFATGTKPDYVPIGLEDIRTAHEKVKLPIFCIGGVQDDRLDSILTAGARRVVVVSAFLKAPDVRQAVRTLKDRLPPI